MLGLVLADKGYTGKKNAEYVSGKKGSFFCPYKKNANPTGFGIWGKSFQTVEIFSLAVRGNISPAKQGGSGVLSTEKKIRRPAAQQNMVHETTRDGDEIHRL